MFTNDDKVMSVPSHIDEIRRRLLWSLLVLIVFVGASFLFTQYLIELLTRPMGGPQNLQAIEITENVGVFMRVALLSGFIMALPFILYQLIAYIWPGLDAGQRRWMVIALPFASFLFLGGVAFAYFVMIPPAVLFLTGFLETPTTPRLANYINFVTSLLFWVGLSFETPLIVFILAKLKFVSADALRKQWRVAVVIIALLAAFVTPTVDPVNMALLMAPLFALYILSVGLAYLAS